MSARNLVLTVVLLVAAAGSWLLLDRRPESETAAPTPVDAGYYVRGAVIEGIGEDGNRVYTLNANRIIQDPTSSAVILEVVDLEYSLPDTEPWRLHADSGEIPDLGQRIELRGNVVLNEKLMSGDSPTTISTPSLDIDLGTHLASTPDIVAVERDNYRLNAVGMVADLKEQTLRLQSEVHGQFLP